MLIISLKNTTNDEIGIKYIVIVKKPRMKREELFRMHHSMKKTF